MTAGAAIRKPIPRAGRGSATTPSAAARRRGCRRCSGRAGGRWARRSERRNDPDFLGDPYARYGGRSLPARSHGEAFLAVMLNRDVVGLVRLIPAPRPLTTRVPAAPPRPT